MVLDRWARKGTDQTAEFMPVPDMERMAEALVAFANADGGTIVVGATPEGTIQRGLLSEEVEAVLREAQARCRPAVRVDWQSSGTDDGLPILLTVPRSTDLHSLADGRVLIRSGHLNRPLGGEEILQLASGKGSGEFELSPVPGATYDDLDPLIIEEYLQKRQERLPHTLMGSPTSVLSDIGAIDAAGRPTVAGELLFGRRPQTYLPKTGLVFVRFLGGGRGQEATAPTMPYGRREEITGPLPTVIRAAWDVLWQEMHPKAAVNGLTRQDVTDYPPAAVREALVNAVAHRDYKLGGRQIEVRMYDDRMEIISPGGLPGYITVENIVDEHFSRNPRIVNGLYYWGYIEELGTGVDRMIEEMVRAGHPMPEFRATPYSFTVTLRSVQERAPLFEWEGDMNERQLKAVNYVQQRGSITNREYRELCPHVSPETLRLDLSDLATRGILLKIGDKRGTYYILK